MTRPHEEWINRADDDLKFAKIGLREGFHSQVCFLSQQVVEKCLKGYLVFQGQSYPKIHSLLELSRSLAPLSGRNWKERLAILDGYYVPLRYPDAAPGAKSSGPPSKKEAQEALQTAQDVLQLIVSLLH